MPCFHARTSGGLACFTLWIIAAAPPRDSVQVARDGMQMLALAYALWNVTPALARLRHAALAAQTMAAAEALWRERFGAFEAADLRHLKRVRRFCRVLLGPAGAQAAWQRGSTRPLAEVVQAVVGPQQAIIDRASLD